MEENTGNLNAVNADWGSSDTDFCSISSSQFREIKLRIQSVFLTTLVKSNM